MILHMLATSSSEYFLIPDPILRFIQAIVSALALFLAVYANVHQSRRFIKSIKPSIVPQDYFVQLQKEGNAVSLLLPNPNSIREKVADGVHMVRIPITIINNGMDC